MDLFVLLYVFFSFWLGETYRSRKTLGLNASDIDNEVIDQTLSKSRNPICTPAAILELPSDGFTRENRQNGWIMIHALIACYCFWLLATICDEYFVPAIEVICSCMFDYLFLILIPFCLKFNLLICFYFVLFTALNLNEDVGESQTQLGIFLLFSHSLILI